MITNLTLPSLSQIKSGTILTRTDTRYVAVTSAQGQLESLMEDRSAPDNRRTDNFTVIAVQRGFFREESYIGCYKVSRLEVLDRLERRDDKLHVRFQGEYTTLTLSLDELLTKPSRRLVRNSSEEILGLYHEANERYLMTPDSIKEENQTLRVSLPESVTTLIEEPKEGSGPRTHTWNQRMARVLRRTRSTIASLYSTEKV